MRATKRVVAATVAAAVTAAGVLALIEIVHAARGPGYAVVDWPAAVRALTRNTWSDLGPRVLGGVLAGLGLLGLWLGLRRDRGTVEPLVPPDPSSTWFTSRRSVRRSLRAAAFDLPGVTRARVRVRRGRARVAVTLAGYAPPGTEPELVDRLHRRLDAFGLARPPALKVRPPRRHDAPPPPSGTDDPWNIKDARNLEETRDTERPRDSGARR